MPSQPKAPGESIATRPLKQKKYELKDHLGNVLAVVSDRRDAVDDGNGDVDYYNAYGKDYQGQLKDEETGWNAFELRMYDARIGRWLTTDPYYQHKSPYLAMSNNPVSFIDPDGGEELRTGLEPATFPMNNRDILKQLKLLEIKKALS